MELKITQKKDSPLLHRLELEGELAFSGPTPSNQTIIKELAAQFKVDEKLIVLKHIYSQFGSTKADLLAFIYHDETSLKRIEFIKVPKKKEEKKEEAPKKKA